MFSKCSRPNQIRGLDWKRKKHFDSNVFCSVFPWIIFLTGTSTGSERLAGLGFDCVLNLLKTHTFLKAHLKETHNRDPAQSSEAKEEYERYLGEEREERDRIEEELLRKHETTFRKIKARGPKSPILVRGTKN